MSLCRNFLRRIIARRKLSVKGIQLHSDMNMNMSRPLTTPQFNSLKICIAQSIILSPDGINRQNFIHEFEATLLRGLLLPREKPQQTAYWNSDYTGSYVLSYFCCSRCNVSDKVRGAHFKIAGCLIVKRR